MTSLSFNVVFHWKWGFSSQSCVHKYRDLAAVEPPTRIWIIIIIRMRLLQNTHSLQKSRTEFSGHHFHSGRFLPGSSSLQQRPLHQASLQHGPLQPLVVPLLHLCQPEVEGVKTHLLINQPHLKLGFNKRKIHKDPHHSKDCCIPDHSPGHLPQLPLHRQGAAVDPLQAVHVGVQHLQESRHATCDTT